MKLSLSVAVSMPTEKVADFLFFLLWKSIFSSTRCPWKLTSWEWPHDYPGEVNHLRDADLHHWSAEACTNQSTSSNLYKQSVCCPIASVQGNIGLYHTYSTSGAYRDTELLPSLGSGICQYCQLVLTARQQLVLQISVAASVNGWFACISAKRVQSMVQ